VKLSNHLWLADLNVPDEAVAELRANDWDIRRPAPVDRSDREILRSAHRESRVVLTQDTDFGQLAVADSEPLIGLVLLRPGHFPPGQLVETLRAVERLSLALEPPFILVVVRRGNEVRVRLRRPATGDRR
jgi:predicted nuclease of predicted toxin-antitoxin system